jgi:hypothetical protein
MPQKKSKEFRFPISTLVGSSYFNLRQIVKNKHIDPEYRSRYILTLVVSAILDPLGKAENFSNRSKIQKNMPVEPPVFIIGFWRSGTTFLHNLLSFDKQFAYVSTFQGIFPNHLLWHKWWLEKIINLLMPKRRPIDLMELNLDYPQEEEIAMGNLQRLSFYNFFYFPQSFHEYVDEALLFNNIDDREIKQWKESYQKLIAKAIIKSNGQRFLSKSPSNTFRINKILELFPDAKFIYLNRNPYKVLTSFNLFMTEVIKGVGFQDFNKQKHIENICDLYTKMLYSYDIDREQIDPENLIELKYEDFVADPMKHLERIYNQFKLNGFSENKSVFAEQVVDKQNHTSSRYRIDAEIKQFINENLAGYLKKNGYQTMD